MRDEPGDLWVLGDHRLLCGDATDPDDVVRLLDGAEPTLLATDPPYGVALDPTWRDGVYNELGPAEQPWGPIVALSDITQEGCAGARSGHSLGSSSFRQGRSFDAGRCGHRDGQRYSGDDAGASREVTALWDRSVA